MCGDGGGSSGSAPDAVRVSVFGVFVALCGATGGAPSAVVGMSA